MGADSPDVQACNEAALIHTCCVYSEKGEERARRRYPLDYNSSSWVYGRLRNMNGSDRSKVAINSTKPAFGNQVYERRVSLPNCHMAILCAIREDNPATIQPALGRVAPTSYSRPPHGEQPPSPITAPRTSGRPCPYHKSNGGEYLISMLGAIAAIVFCDRMMISGDACLTLLPVNRRREGALLIQDRNRSVRRAAPLRGLLLQHIARRRRCGDDFGSQWRAMLAPRSVVRRNGSATSAASPPCFNPSATR